MTAFPPLPRALMPVATGALLGLVSQAWAETPQSVTDIPPVQSLVSMVAGEDAPVALLWTPASSAHAIALKPSQARAIGQAGLVVWIGPELSPGLEDQFAALAPNARQLVLSDVEGVHLLAFREGAFGGHDDHAAEDDHAAHADEGHDDHADHDDHDDHAEEGHDNHHHDGAFDPHLWLAPENAVTWVAAIADTLADLDPENAAQYRANAAEATARIEAAEASAKAALAPLQGKPLASSHDAFQYFEEAFGLTMVGAISDGDEAAPGPQRLADLRDHLAEEAPVCVLMEPGSDPRMVEAILPEGTPRVDLDPLGSDLEQGPGLYPALIEHLAVRIADCAK